MVHMRATFITSMLGISLLGLSCAATAATVDLTQSPGTAPTLNPSDVGLIVPLLPETTSFTDDWFFTLSLAGGVDAAVISINLVVGPGLDYSYSSLSASLFDYTTSTPVPGTGGGTSFTASLVSGDIYEVIVQGTPNGSLGGLYSGAVDVVPLPAAAWLLLSGLAGMGLLARRRLAD
jgi:hypothetical protein